MERFLALGVQTVIGPALNAFLYQIIFIKTISSHITLFGVRYAVYLLPGIIMMQMLSGGFLNSSSSLIEAKYTNNIMLLLMAPISRGSLYLVFLLSSIMRATTIGIAIYLLTLMLGNIVIPHSILGILFFLIFGTSITAAMGVISGVVCDRFPSLSFIQSFVLVPLVYLSGVFFSINTLHGIWKHIAYLDPFWYIIDGFRSEFLGIHIINMNECYVIVFGLAAIFNFTAYLFVKWRL